MKAILQGEEAGSPLVWTETETPTPGPGQVRIRVAATAVNRADLLQRRGLYPPPPGASSILGLEASGEIDALGDGVCGWSVGDRVCALLTGGGYAEQVVVEASSVLPVPKGLSLTQAAALPEAFATAVLTLQFEARLQAGERVLLHAGASGVGTAAIQLCKAWKTPVFVTTGSEEKIIRCLDLGAEAGHNRHQGSFLNAVKDWSGGQGADVILDPVGGDYFQDNQRALATDGRLVHIGLLGGRMANLDLGRLLVKRQRLIGCTLRSRSLAAKSRLIQWMGTHIWPLFERSTLHPIICATISLPQVEEAHQLIASNTTVGKVILTLP
jgi:putative PIG3 family NAD(P)H quinone oxidoreductase